MSEVPKNPAEMLNYLIRTGWDVSTWSIEFSTKSLIIKFKDKHEIAYDNNPEPGELCPLCNKPINNGKAHGSWCK